MQTCMLLLLLAQPPAVADWSYAEKAQFLRTAKIQDMKTLSQGITNSRRATLARDGFVHDAHIQSINEYRPQFNGTRGNELNFRDSFRFNIAAYEIDRLLDLNMVPVTVIRKVAGTESAVTWWVDDVYMTELQRYKKSINPPDPARWAAQMAIVRVFDQLIANTDRNLGNLLIQSSWNVWMIDHTRAFRIRRDLLEPHALQRCDRELLNRLRALDRASVRDAVKPYVLSIEIEGILARRAAIVELIESRVRQRGEAAVLYDYLKPRGENRQ